MNEMRKRMGERDDASEIFRALADASPEDRARALRALRGEAPPLGHGGPLFETVTAAARRSGLSRATIYRLIADGRLHRVEIRRGTYRLRCAEVDRLAE